MQKFFYAMLLAAAGCLLAGCRSTEIISPAPTNAEQKIAAQELVKKLAEPNGVWAYYSAKYREKAKKNGKSILPVVVTIEPVFKLHQRRRRVPVDTLNSEFKRLALERGLFHNLIVLREDQKWQVERMQE